MDYLHAIIKSAKLTLCQSCRCIEPYKKKIIVSLLSVLFIFTVLYAVFVQAPHNFPSKTTVTIENGATLQEVSLTLKDARIIKFAPLYTLINVISQNQSNIQAGDYYFHRKENVFRIAARIVIGDYGLTPVTVFIPEGSTLFDIGEIFENTFKSFNADAFIKLALAKDAEGYLFPDTYNFFPNVSEKKVFNVMRKNFDTKLASIADQLNETEFTIKDIIIMASIIEKESAHDFEQRNIISGILWNRIRIGMPLQVDAVFPYIIGKNTFELSTDDLTVDSPYNTYKYKGLPIGPISNPSLDSIIAAALPAKTEYLYYLHDLNGGVHYSIDFEMHKANKFKYLR